MHIFSVDMYIYIYTYSFVICCIHTYIYMGRLSNMVMKRRATALAGGGEKTRSAWNSGELHRPVPRPMDFMECWILQKIYITGTA